MFPTALLVYHVTFMCVKKSKMIKLDSFGNNLLDKEVENLIIFLNPIGIFPKILIIYLNIFIVPKDTVMNSHL